VGCLFLGSGLRRETREGQLPSRISTEREVAYLRALAETGNATLAAEAAGVSRDWAYKRSAADSRFGRLCAEMFALAKARLPARVNRDRAGGWTAATEERFLAVLAATADVPLAASSAGSTAPAAYRRRIRRPGFANRWSEALAADERRWALDWFESAKCFFERRPVPPENPVRVTSIAEVLRMLGRAARTR
jgi:hypothetical protein